MSWLDGLNWVDWVMGGILSGFLIYGLTRGFVRQILGIAGILLALALAARYARALSEVSYFDSVRERGDGLARVLAYIAIFVATGVAVGVITALLGWIPVRKPWKDLKNTDSFLGAVLGALQGVLLLGGISIGLLEWNHERAWPVRSSVLAPRLAEGCRALVLLIPEKGRQEIQEGYRRGMEEVEEALPIDAGQIHANPPTTPSPVETPPPAEDLSGSASRPAR